MSETKSIAFNMGIPDFDSMIVVEGYGYAQLRNHYENGDVLLYMGGNRMMRLPGESRWRYANRSNRVGKKRSEA